MHSCIVLAGQVAKPEASCDRMVSKTNVWTCLWNFSSITSKHLIRLVYLHSPSVTPTISTMHSLRFTVLFLCFQRESSRICLILFVTHPFRKGMPLKTPWATCTKRSSPLEHVDSDTRYFTSESLWLRVSDAESFSVLRRENLKSCHCVQLKINRLVSLNPL